MSRAQQHEGLELPRGPGRGVPLLCIWLHALQGLLAPPLVSPLLDQACPAGPAGTVSHFTLPLSTRGSLNETAAHHVAVRTGKEVPRTHAPTPRARTGEEGLPTTESVTAPILARARKLAGLWVAADKGQASYLEWMDFCEDWARHRLKQMDVNAEPPRERANPVYMAWWAWAHAPDPLPRRTSIQLDQMAHDICEEAWDQGRNLREVLMALARRLQERALLPTWFFQAIA